MKIIILTIITIFFNINNKIDKNICLNQVLAKTEINSKESFSKKELIRKYSKIGYELISYKEHTVKSTKNCFFVFVQEKKKAIFGKRILLVCNKNKNSKIKILSEKDKLIYQEGTNLSCSTVDPFNGIIVKDLYITIEQNCCTKRRGETVHEYFTFKFDLVSKEYLLDKYSIIIEETTIGDEFPVQTLTEKDFGIIKLKDYYNGVLDKYKVKFPEHIYEIIK